MTLLTLVGEAEKTGEPEKTSCPSPDLLVACLRPRAVVEEQISHYHHSEELEEVGSHHRPLPEEEEGVQTPRCDPPVEAGVRMQRHYSVELAVAAAGIGCCWEEVGVENP